MGKFKSKENIVTEEHFDDVVLEENDEIFKFTPIPNDLIRDHTISPNCRWLIIYLLSNKPGWTIKSKQIWNHTKGFIGRDAGLKIFSEAIAAGYIKREIIIKKNEAGKIIRGLKYTVASTPKFKKCLHEPENQDTGNQEPDFQGPGIKGPVIQGAKERTSKEILNKEILNKESFAQTASPLRNGEFKFSFEKQDFEGIEEKDLNDWKTLYPSVDIKREILAMKQWIMANPTKSKSKKQWRRFINSWLSKENEKNINKQAYQATKQNGGSSASAEKNYALSKRLSIECNSKNYIMTLLSKEVELTPKGAGQPICINYSELGFCDQLVNAMRKCGFEKMEYYSNEKFSGA